MASTDCSQLVARAIPLPTETKPEDLTEIDSITNKLNETKISKKDAEVCNVKAEKKSSGRSFGGAISPADFVTMQSLRSSALARKMNTTSKLTRDCRNLFSDLMQNNSQTNNEVVCEKAKTSADDKKSIENEHKVKSIEEFIKEVEAAKKNWIKVIRPKLVAKEVKPKGEKTDEKDADKEQLISRGPIRICSRSVGGYQPYTTAEHGVAPQSTTNDPSNFNPNVYNYTYDCGVGGYDYYWANSCETVSSNSATPDTVNSDPNCIHEDAADNELPESLSDFILKYSRRYTPSPDGSKCDEKEPLSVWTDSPNSVTSLETSDSACNSPMSAVSAPNNSPTAPRGGQTPNYGRGDGDYGGGWKFGMPKQSSVDSGICGNGGMQVARPAKDRFRALIQGNDMDEAWAWTCKCIQHHPNALSYQDSDKDTLLHIVSQHADLAKIYALVEQMIKLETRIDEAPLFDIPNDKGQTPLIIAVEKRRNEVVDYLVEAGASPNTHKTIGDKDAPLHYAATRGLMKIVQRLCSYAHTNLNAINGIGLTPLLCAFKTHGLIDEETRSIVSNIGVIQLLLKHGADPTIADTVNGKTIIHVAVERMQPELIEIFRACTQESSLVSVVNKLDLAGKSPLDYLDGFGSRMASEMQSRIRLALVTCGAKQ